MHFQKKESAFYCSGPFLFQSISYYSCQPSTPVSQAVDIHLVVSYFRSDPIAHRLINSYLSYKNVAMNTDGPQVQLHLQHQELSATASQRSTHVWRSIAVSVYTISLFSFLYSFSVYLLSTHYQIHCTKKHQLCDHRSKKYISIFMLNFWLI